MAPETSQTRGGGVKNSSGVSSVPNFWPDTKGVSARTKKDSEGSVVGRIGSSFRGEAKGAFRNLYTCLLDARCCWQVSNHTQIRILAQIYILLQFGKRYQPSEADSLIHL